ncbi:hypothetical protein T4E_5365 [Trichinella pseudospiralis]|uniref:Uncharacterized protein n=1 Tax=Trichinella pseudospiralis TaxID=6337 RepID=A0A0V0YCK9_TRIPS|nr:hypothetical protein T4E_5365 [Trichinella pseudospiralis]
MDSTIWCRRWSTCPANEQALSNLYLDKNLNTYQSQEVAANGKKAKHKNVSEKKKKERKKERERERERERKKMRKE